MDSDNGIKDIRDKEQGDSFQTKTKTMNNNSSAEQNFEVVMEDLNLDLRRQLDEDIPFDKTETRPGQGGRKFTYCETHTILNTANRLFGFDGWSSEIKSLDVDCVEQTRDGKWEVAASCIMKVTVNLKDGTCCTKEDVGMGISVMPKKSDAIEKAKKTGASDALKRTFRQCGNAMGLCLYDKGYIKRAQVKGAGAKGPGVRPRPY